MNKTNNVDDLQNIPRPKLERQNVDDLQNIPRPKLERHPRSGYKYVENNNKNICPHSSDCHIPIMDYETYEREYMISKKYNN